MLPWLLLYLHCDVALTATHCNIIHDDIHDVGTYMLRLQRWKDVSLFVYYMCKHLIDHFVYMYLCVMAFLHVHDSYMCPSGHGRCSTVTLSSDSSIITV